MQTSVAKWGNSQGIRLPKAFLKSINIKEILKKINYEEHIVNDEMLELAKKYMEQKIVPKNYGRKIIDIDIIIINMI